MSDFNVFVDETSNQVQVNESAQTVIIQGLGVNNYNNYSLLLSQIGDKTVANTVAETSLIDGILGSATLPADFLKAGKVIEFKVTGYHSSQGNPTLRVKVKIGSTTVLDTGSVLSGNSTDAVIQLSAFITVRSIGATGTVIGNGVYQELGTGTNIFPMLNKTVSTINTTIANTMDITLQWGTASSNNTMTTTNLIIESRYL